MAMQPSMGAERLVVYSSKYGSTQDYAMKLGQELSCRAMELSNVDAEDLVGLDQVIFGGPMRNGSIHGAKDFFKLVKQSDTLARIAVFTNGVSRYEEEYFSVVRERDIDEHGEEIPLFYTRGRWDPAEMTFIDRGLVKALVRSASKRDPKEMSLTEATLQEVGEDPADWTNYEYLAPVIAWARGEDEPGIGKGTRDERLAALVGQTS